MGWKRRDWRMVRSFVFGDPSSETSRSCSMSRLQGVRGCLNAGKRMSYVSTAPSSSPVRGRNLKNLGHNRLHVILHRYLLLLRLQRMREPLRGETSLAAYCWPSGGLYQLYVSRGDF